MDKDALISNIERYARAAGVSPSRACIESGAGKSFICLSGDSSLVFDLEFVSETIE